jgi:hypothetical protein
LRRIRGAKELHVLAQRPAALASGLAEDAGGRDCVEKRRCWLTSKNLPPCRIGVDASGLSGTGAAAALELVFAVH